MEFHQVLNMFKTCSRHDLIWDWDVSLISLIKIEYLVIMLALALADRDIDWSVIRICEKYLNRHQHCVSHLLRTSLKAEFPKIPRQTEIDIFKIVFVLFVE